MGPGAVAAIGECAYINDMRHSPAVLILGTILALPASAAMPTWPVNGEETYTQWPTMSFNDGKAVHTLHCRLSECEPGKGKGIVNLYTWSETAVEPIKSTIHIVKYYDKWDPRRLWNGDWYTVPEVVDSHRRTYQTKLSHWKVDMDAKPIAAFQGDKRVPASSSVGQAAMSETGSKIKVLPPTVMADDQYKPDTRRDTPTPPRNRNGNGNGTGSGSEEPVATFPDDAEWFGKVTPLTQWLAVTGRHGTFHCFVPGNPGAAGTGAWLKSANKGGVCVEWTVPSDDAVADEGGSKYKTRTLVNRGVIYHRGGKVVLHMGSARVSQNPTIAAVDAAKFGATHVKVNPKTDAPETPAGVLALTSQEQVWLTRAEKADCADAAKAADCRAKIKANLRPEAVAAWETAVATKKAADIDAALAKVEMWGKNVTTGVGPAGANTEIQLSAEEYEKLKKDAAALEKYNDERAGLTGGSEGAPINRAFYDPVALHKITEAYRKTLGGGTTGGNQPSAEVPNGPLSDEELALLTPDELLRYQGMKKAHEKDPNNPAMLALNQELRKKILDEGRKPYSAPADEAAFNAMQNWQKKKFCAELPGPTAAAADTKSDFNQGARGDQAVDALKSNTKKTKKGGEQKSAEAPSWAADACAKFKAEQSYTGGGDGGNDHAASEVAAPVAADKEKAEKEPSKWLAPKHLYNGAKGAILGMLIGSFFGPVGFIVGAAIGGATFYGVSHLQSMG